VNEDYRLGGGGLGREPDKARSVRVRRAAGFDLPSEANDLAERFRLAREKAANAAANALPRGPLTPHPARHVPTRCGAVDP
jgi:hypothetical protein